MYKTENQADSQSTMALRISAQPLQAQPVEGKVEKFTRLPCWSASLGEDAIPSDNVHKILELLEANQRGWTNDNVLLLFPHFTGDVSDGEYFHS